MKYFSSLFQRLKDYWSGESSEAKSIVSKQFGDYLPFGFSLLAIIAIIYDVGFEHNLKKTTLQVIYIINLVVGVFFIINRYTTRGITLKLSVALFDIFSVMLFLILILQQLLQNPSIVYVLGDDIWLYAALFLIFVRELSALNISLTRTVLNPAQLFIVSFILIILVGALFLMLPNATKNGISFIDAIFTSASAVCVTGLAVVDTEFYFTRLGQVTLMILIEIGGLGIMTFVSYFSYFFRGITSYENQLTLSEMNNTGKLSEVFSSLKNVILITFLVEGLGAVLIFLSLQQSPFESLEDRVFFSIFHSISAFCNAGFSTLSNGLYDPTLRFNYPLLITIASLFILGGLGFPIVFGIYRYVKHVINNQLLSRSFNQKIIYIPWIINLSTRIILITTASLIAVGTVLFFIFEYNNTLSEHSLGGKIVTAFFGAVTPRTAGFNSVDMKMLTFPTIMITFLLMWIGASPASTGGGIKTTTFAIATLNFFSLAKGKTRIEIYRREISDTSVRRAFATISLSLVILGGAIFLLSFFEADKDLLSLAFECFSAYSTVGLTLGITGNLSDAGKLVIVAVMFVGRVSMLSILIALFSKSKYKYYRYPTEDILIN